MLQRCATCGKTVIASVALARLHCLNCIPPGIRRERLRQLGPALAFEVDLNRVCFKLRVQHRREVTLWSFAMAVVAGIPLVALAWCARVPTPELPSWWMLLPFYWAGFTGLTDWVDLHLTPVWVEVGREGVWRQKGRSVRSELAVARELTELQVEAWGGGSFRLRARFTAGHSEVIAEGLAQEAQAQDLAEEIERALRPAAPSPHPRARLQTPEAPDSEDQEGVVPLPPELRVEQRSRELVARWDWWRGYQVHVDEDRLRVRSRFSRPLELVCDDIRAVRIAEVGRPPDNRFRLLVKLRNGNDCLLLDGIRSPEPVRFLEREIKRVLQLERAETTTSAEAFDRVWGDLAPGLGR